jgi:hypothetical protein
MNENNCNSQLGRSSGLAIDGRCYSENISDKIRRYFVLALVPFLIFSGTTLADSEFKIDDAKYKSEEDKLIIKG